MKRILVLTLVTGMMSLITACSKKDSITEQFGADFQRRGPWLQRMDYVTFDAKAEFYYNADSTQKSIIYISPNTYNTISFSYSNKRLVQVKDEGAQRTSDYQYNAAGQITSITMKSAYSFGYYNMEFSYNANGRVHALELYLNNEAGSKLQWSSFYEYNAQGLVSKVTATDNKNNQVIYSITEYSEPCDFNPWSFINLGSLAPLYDIYNWPVLSSMNRLPKKIVQSTGKSAPVVESIKATQFFIQSKRIEKTILSTSSASGTPTQSGVEVNFIY